jgi:hypothetical protein
VFAVEEAKEVLDRRQGRAPASSHGPVDFLDPCTWPEDLGLDPAALLLPEPLQPGDLRAATAAGALEWLRLTAARPFCDTGVSRASGALLLG